MLVSFSLDIVHVCVHSGEFVLIDGLFAKRYYEHRSVLLLLPQARYVQIQSWESRIGVYMYIALGVKQRAALEVCP